MCGNKPIRPIPKNNTPINPEDYRPINILPVLGKVFEKIIHKQITNYLTQYGLLDKFQSGFKPNHSTTTALLKVTNDIYLAKDRGQMTILALLDLSKAFDCVDRDILLAKLRSMKFSENTLAWMQSFLSDRKQSVSVGNNVSNWRSTEAGVPQGSVLSPLLFSIYLCDLSEQLKHCRYHLYADDMQLYIHTKPNDIQETIEKLNEDLTNIQQWTEIHSLKVNPLKSQAIIIGSEKAHTKLKAINTPPIKFQDTEIVWKESVKNLGIIFDKNLNWSEQITKICQRVYYSLHALKRMRDFLPTNTRKLLIETLIFPIFDYGDVVYNNIREELASKLQRACNACIRFIYNVPTRAHISPYRKQLMWLTLRNRRQSHCTSLAYKILHSNVPHYLRIEFQYLHTYRTTSRSVTNSLLQIPIHKGSEYSKTFLPATIREWNSLPPGVRAANNMKAFKKLSHEFYLNGT